MNASSFNVVVSNQSAVARQLLTIEELYNYTRRLESMLASENLYINAWMFCPHHFEGIGENGYACECRKPNTLMIEDALIYFGIERKDTIFYGDSNCDEQAANWSEVKYCSVK